MATSVTGKATEFIQFTRASNATVTDSDGKIKWAPHNLLTNSESFDASAWTKTALTVSANNAAAPNGTTTADKLIPSATSNYHNAYQGAITSGVGYSVSVYAKAAGYNFLYVANSSTTASAIFNLSTGAVSSTGAGATSAMTSLADGWYLCTITFTSTSTNAIEFGVSNTSTWGVFTGDGTSGILLWGAHLYRSDLGGMQANTSAYPMYNPTTPKNLLGYTEDFSNAAWTKANATVTANSIVGPNGLQTADLIAENTATSLHSVYQTFSCISGTKYAFSAYVKPAGRTIVRLSPQGTATLHIVEFDLTGAGTATTRSGSGTAAITALSDGWYRISTVVTATASGTGYWQFDLCNGANSANYAGDGVSGAYLWGAQLSDSASLDAYSPVYGAAVTSAAYYGPRRDFDPVSLACKGLLVEEQRTNSVLNSGLSGGVSGTPGTAPTSWTYFATGTPAVTFAADTETVTGFTARVVTDTTQRLPFGQTISVLANTTYFLSAVVDVTTSSGVYQHISWSSVPSGATVTYGIDGVAVAGTTTIASGRHIISSTLVVSTTAGTAAMRLGSGVQLAGAASDITFRQIQVEAGAFRTSYIPTGAATATRSADVASVSTQAFPYSSTEGTLVVSGDFSGVVNTPAAAFVALTDGVASGSPSLSYAVLWKNTTVAAAGRRSTAGVATNITVSDTTAANATIKLGTAFSVNGTDALSVNGGATGTQAGVTSAYTDTIMRIGNFGVNPAYLNGHIRQITYLPRRISNADLIVRTA